MRFRPDVEGLRAVAVVAVVLYHSGVGFAGGGFAGVDVFFVLSGFLITSLMLGEIAETSRLSLIRFYGRRARRLLPAATMVIAVTVVAGWALLSPLTLRDLVGDAIAATTYTVNWRFAARGTDYFQAELAPSALQHYWSLAVEEQFYILWPALIAILAGRRLRRGVLTAGVGAVVIASFWIAQIVTAESQPWAFFGTHTRMWQLGLGALAAICWPLIERLPEVVRRVAPPLGLAAIAYSVVVYSESTAWPGTAALVPSLGSLAVIVGAPRAPTTPLLGARPVVWLGARSYSWYLWHWPALVFFAAWRDEPLTVPVALAVAAASLVLAHLGYTFVEQPIRHSPTLVASARRSLTVGLAFSLVCLIGLLAVRPTATHVVAGGAPASTLTVPDLPAPALLEEAATTPAVPSNLRPSLSDARDDLPEVYSLGCHADIPVIEPEICELGDPSGGATAVLIGDSHAAQWAPAFDSLAGRSGIRFLPMTKSGCPVADVTVYSTVLNRVYGECDDWRHEVFAAVNDLQPDVVIVTQSAQVNPDGVPEGQRIQAVSEGWIRTIGALASSGADVVVIADTPYPTADVPDCLSANVDDATACTMSRAESMRFRGPDLERSAAAAGGARFIDPVDLVCGPTRCPVIVGDLLVYRDASHLTTPFVRWLEAPLAALLGEPWRAP